MKKRLITLIFLSALSLSACNSSSIKNSQENPVTQEQQTSGTEYTTIYSDTTSSDTTTVVSETTTITTNYGEVENPDIRNLKWGMSIKQVEFYEGTDYTLEEGIRTNGKAYKAFIYKNREFADKPADLTLCFEDGFGLDTVSYTLYCENGFLFDYAMNTYGVPVEENDSEMGKMGNWNDEVNNYAIYVFDFKPIEGFDSILPIITISPLSTDLIIPTEDVNFENTVITTQATTEKPVSTYHDPTMGEKNALKTALRYLNYTAFSYKGLIEQLEFEGYTHSEAVYGADNCGADWNEQAAKCAKKYLDYSSFSRTGLIEQLEFEGFTHSQAVYGVEANGY